MFQGWQKCNRDHPLTPGGRGGNRGSLGVSKSNFIKSKSFTNKSCQVCFKGDKNSFGVTFWPLGARGHSGGRGLGVSKSNFIKSKSFANKSCQVCFRGDKKSFGVTLWPLRVQAHLGRPLGESKNFIKSKNFVNKSCLICFRGHKNQPGTCQTWSQAVVR